MSKYKIKRIGDNDRKSNQLKKKLIIPYTINLNKVIINFSVIEMGLNEVY